MIYLVGNKIDLEEERTVSKEKSKNYAKKNNLRYFEVSCLNKQGIQEFFDDLINELIKR